MSGMTYRKLTRGPIADSFFRILDELEEDATIIRETKGKATLFSLVEREVSGSRLSDEELNLIKKIGLAWRGKSTEDIEKFTHEQLPWQICREGEAIPYELITQEEPKRILGPINL